MNTPSVAPPLRSRKNWRIWLAVATFAILLVALVLAYALGMLPPIGSTNPESFVETVRSFGSLGPVAIVLLLIAAIVFSPLPSAPIAVASGALYGHGWGALYVLVGAQLGAMICFGLARSLGYDVIHRWFGDKLNVGLLGSQRVLGYGVLVSRLLPFISFDIVSYAAGLTVLRFWRFAAATLIGTAPSSFLLAHVGSEVSTGEFSRIGFTVVLLGFATALPFLAARFFRKKGKPH